VLFAVAAVAQQRAASDVPEGEALLAGLIRSPRWWAGMIGDAGGFGLQVAALALGSVLVVQPILVSSLVFALPLAAHYSGRRVTAGMWVQALALSAALAVFLIVGDPTQGLSDVAWHRWMGPMVALLAVTAVAVAAGLAARAAAMRALLLGTGAGLLFGLSSALTDHITKLFDRGPGALFSSWELYALAAAGLLGLYLQQRGYQAGALSASLPAFTVTEPLGAVFIGMTVLGERLRSGPVGTGFVVLSVLVMCVEAVRLSRAQAATDSVPEDNTAALG
jgi:drug/metabolite transporter (DMT)-like permease